MKKPDTLPDLIAALSDLEQMAPIERARRAPVLIEAAKGVLADVRAGAVREAVAGGERQADVARELGMRRQKVNDIITGRR